MFILMPGSKEAMRSPIQARRPGTSPVNLFSEVAKIKQHGKKVGSEKVGRYQADIYEQVLPVNQKGIKGNVTTRTSVSPGVPVPVKVVTKTSMGQSVMLLKSVKVNPVIPDSMFELPPGTKISAPPSGGLGARPSPH
jgi:hypothetical protein